MAPIQRRASEISPQAYIAIISLVALFVCGIFCCIVFYKVCSKQRKREKAMRRMQEERTPFVGAQYMAPVGAQSKQQSPPYVHPSSPQELNTYRYDGPLELQGSGRPGPPPVHQIDGYTAAPSFDDKAIEMPAYAAVKGTNNGYGAPR
ncbi:hypothetical protein PtrSN002B_007468 [Pyrenophora tritici-repentis]|uniref:Uncharacterized protein n=2 Tax=Pyrenophora tritici-repentis TaxID=45151 RepID=A0A2W1DBU5_9PLEO|nr:uncharacterized protein PTRG_06482 [Pyrenophora tritici-repentis Pt-1C-BFP]KAA8613564.1 hypothetical protein PtrV1_12472 [Pyrenophora tritici-repentis]EDU49402.1 predicted protein [Pyrenophora tritici-repentis Pt-1C-BFP]KAF7445274.1 hypothetical protein A1F99_102600 [Pyrenophora tritici-repentis]KAF7565539.1 hypothetical protein PtrM4_049730 [Pyrenophora tritici-repentis]KAG9380333.1 hypothetical protein A1F94_009228 [Pyrenophora tritici-repentis]